MSALSASLSSARVASSSVSSLKKNKTSSLKSARKSLIAPRAQAAEAKPDPGSDPKGLGKALPMQMDIDAIMKLLPHRYPFLLVDRVLEIEQGSYAIGVKNVTINDNFFPGHFPQRPIMPGVLMVEAMAQVGGLIMLEGGGGEGKILLSSFCFALLFVLLFYPRRFLRRVTFSSFGLFYPLLSLLDIAELDFFSLSLSRRSRAMMSSKPHHRFFKSKQTGGTQQEFFFAGINGVKFRRPVVPGDQLVMKVVLTKLNKRFGIAKMKGQAFVGEELACEAELTLALGS